jgi:hypothetical protein
LIGNGSNLAKVVVVNNTFTGTIPKSVENWGNIQYARFEGNAFTGTMPSGICSSLTRRFFNVQPSKAL